MNNYSLGWWELNEDNTYRYINGHLNLKLDRELSDTEKENIDTSLACITQLVTYHSYYLIELDNMNELKSLIYKLNDKSKRLEPPYFDLDNDHQLQRLLGITVLQFVLYINHIEYTLKGKLKEQFKLISSKYYDSYFEYRFLYKLRNYITHCSLPEITIQNNINLKYRKICIETNALLKTYNSWSTLKHELEEKQNGIDLLELIEKASIMFLQFHKDVLKINENNYAKSMLFLSSYVKVKNKAVVLPVLVNPYTEEELKQGKLGWSHAFKIFSKANQIMLDLNIDEFNYYIRLH